LGQVTTDLGPESEAPARVGQVLRDKYTLERVLGIGGMAAVYAASHRNGRKVAIKILHRELSVNKDVRERFLREGQAANAVGHPGAVAVLDDDVSEEGAAFLVMELLDGGSAEELAERRGGRLPLADVCAIGEQLLDVLDAAHRNGIVHRDIKPANLFITRHGRVKVLDFGIAKLRQVGSARATQTGLMLGTPAFMAPEQALGRVTDIDARTDIWAVGSTLFSLASGRGVHEAATAQETLIWAATKPAPSFASVMSSAPPELVAVIDRALAFEQGQRWPTAGQMREAWISASRSVRATASNTDTLSVLLQGFRPRGSEFPAAVPVSSATHFAGSRAASPTGGRTNTRRLVVIGAVGALLVAALATAWILGSRSTAERADASAETSSSAVNAATPPTSNSITVSVEAPAAPSPSATAPPAAARPIEARPRPGRPAPRAAKSATAETSSAKSTLPPAPARPNCNPPYELDSEGVKIWKRGCL
jgi:serine/threonine-protein kinase